jgi:site-specific recombinase XerD
MTEVTKQDVVAFRNSLITQVSAKTSNHGLKTLKMLFKSARRDGIVAEDPTEFVETVRRERRPKIKRLPQEAGVPAAVDQALIDCVGGG